MAKIFPIEQSNYCINGSMAFWQRGITFAGLAGGAASYTADRFKYSALGTTGIVTVSQDTDVPTLAESGFQSSFSLKIQPTTADAAVAAGDLSELIYFMEGHEYKKFKGKNIGISFWVKSNKIGTYCIQVANNASDRTYVREYQVLSSNVWEKKVVFVPLDYSGGTDNFTAGIGLSVRWVLMSGTTFQGAADVWNSTDLHSTSNQVNFMDNTANILRITQIQLVEGKVKSSFSRTGKLIEAELALCQRYYAKTYALVTPPASSGAVGAVRAVASGTGTGAASSYWKFPVTMRAVPTITFYNNSTGAAGTWRDGTGADIAVTTSLPGETGTTWINNAVITDTTGFSGHIVVDAEL